MPRVKKHYGFATGDLVKAVVPKGKNAGTHMGRVAVRSSGSFNITTATGTVQGINYKYVRLLQPADGYNYTLKGGTRDSSPRLKPGVSSRGTR